MWYLVNEQGVRIYLKPNKETLIGRKKADIVLPNDKSISKEHASISVTKLEEIRSNEPTSICKLKDLKSKYGTFILHERDIIQLTETECILKHQDTIRFGLQNHVFKVINVPIITTVSTLCDDEIERLKILMEEIDGVIITDSDWRRASTYLTVGNAILTLKLASAMASALPIVTMKYWDEVKSAIDNSQQLPDSNNFVPPISEPLIAKRKVLISPNEKRTTLFKNLTFIHFSTTQYRKYKKIIRIAGGIPQLFERTSLATTEFCSPNVIVLQYSENDSTQITDNIFRIYHSIQQALKANNYRMIAEVEICLAILHCSTEKYCNPMYKFAKLLKRSERKNDSCEILNLDTQDETAKVSTLPTSSFSISTPVKHCIIPETLDISQEPLPNVSGVVIQPTEEQKYNKIRYTRKTPNDTSATENVQVTRSRVISNVPATTSVKIRQRVIPETLSSISSQESQSDVHYILTQPTGKERYNEIQCIKETPTDASARVKNVQVTQPKEISNLLKTTSVQVRQRVIPETLSSISSQELKSNVNFAGTQPTRKQKCNKLQYIDETPNDTSATMASMQDTQSNENNSTFPNMLSQIIRYSNHDNQNLHKHGNIQDKRQSKEVIILSDDEIELTPIQQNKNNNTNSNKDFIHNTSNNIFKTSNLRDENRQMQQTARLTDNRIAAANLKEMCEVDEKIELKNVRPVTLKVEKKHNKETTCSENSITPHTTEPLNTPPICSVEKEKRKHKAQNVISSALKSNSSLRAHPNFKVFKKVPAIVPQKRIKIDSMYVWNKYNTTNENLC
ncbi:nibrin [Bombus pyrosoma]|uniref:nibrin n=1 Tax=Bombus pyrosoma TaxID=396416 RepID=UPI001CB97090|nr:nibrin [Bombus pyrosoma]XP_043581188.1 nibrin [Bombus pyrosoma]XP_043581197.1 nibrin [Bombus pyrosoma]XP_043581208.1 nibrin [Bombus pyrosoma]XP_043581213.1 nibrin [Bombus pyrosoma]